MSENYNVSSSPHIRSRVTTNNIMTLVTASLMPAAIFGVYNFGMPALVVLIITTASAVAAE